MKFTFFAIILIVYLLANYYLFHRIWIAMPPNTIMRVVLVVIAVVCVSSFFLAGGLGESFPVPVTSVMYSIGSSWMFITIYFILFFLFQDLVLLINKGFSIVPSKLVLQLSKENWVGMLFTLAFITLLMFGGYLRYLWKERVYLPIEISKSKNDSLPEKTLRIIAISDLHLGYTISAKELDEWVGFINKENPDMILIAGDLVDNSLRPLRESGHVDVLKKLKAPMGVYACLGNHEYLGNIRSLELQSFFKEANIHLLQDAHVEVDNFLYIVGRDDKTNSDRKELSELVNNLDKSKPIILLDHQPYDLQKADENGIDLQISGHTHKGQVWPISMLTSLLYEKDHGYIKKGNSHIYVSSGLGIWGGKFRIGTKSEFVVIDLKVK